MQYHQFGAYKIRQIPCWHKTISDIRCVVASFADTHTAHTMCIIRQHNGWELLLQIRNWLWASSRRSERASTLHGNFEYRIRSKTLQIFILVNLFLHFVELNGEQSECRRQRQRWILWIAIAHDSIADKRVSILFRSVFCGVHHMIILHKTNRCEAKWVTAWGATEWRECSTNTVRVVFARFMYLQYVGCWCMHEI